MAHRTVEHKSTDEMDIAESNPLGNIEQRQYNYAVRFGMAAME